MDDADLDALAKLRAETFVSRTHPAPIHIIEDFLPPEMRDLVLEGLVRDEGAFFSNRTDGRDALVAIDPEPVRSVIAEFEHRFDDVVATLTRLGAPTEDIDGCHFETPSVTAAGHASFHSPHIDNDPLSGVSAVVTRRISFVWHAFREPRSFEGGELRLWDYADIPSDRGPWTPASTWTDHPCRDNTLIAFSSYSLHEVLPVRAPNGPFSGRRFAVVTAAHAGSPSIATSMTTPSA